MLIRYRERKEYMSFSHLQVKEPDFLTICYYMLLYFVLNCRFFQAVFNALMVLFTYLDRALKNKRIISWSVYFFSLPWLRFTERSHVICSASTHISYILFWCHCANCLITMNVYDTVGWRAMLENWEKFMKKRSILIKNVHNYFNDLKRLVSRESDAVFWVACCFRDIIM